MFIVGSLTGMVLLNANPIPLGYKKPVKRNEVLIQLKYFLFFPNWLMYLTVLFNL